MNRNRAVTLYVLIAAVLILTATGCGSGSNHPSGPSFQVSFPSSLHGAPITGRIFVAMSPTNEIEPRIAAYNSARRRDARVPFFASDVDQLVPGHNATIDSKSVGYPFLHLSQVPAGDYYVQAVLNVYTQFHRSDGHVIWAHMDQWEGQRWGFSPGNLVSKPQIVHFDPSKDTNFQVSLTQALPPIDVPEDTEWVKHVKIQSKILSEFWGYPFFLGATVLLPKGYSQRSNVHYPTVYFQGHFSLDLAF